jgi:hypothetical protein
MVKKMEPLRGVHKPWFEVVEDDGFSWSPPENDCFTGAFGGGACGPSSTILQIARTGSLAKMFLYIIGGDETLDMIVKRTNDYAYKDWVVPKPRLDNGPRPNWMRQIDFVPCGCKYCFFCKNGFTTGVAHKQKKQTKTIFVHHDNSRTVTKDCTDTRVDLLRGNQYCRQCYRERTGTSTEKKQGIPYSRLGCPSCDEHVCDSCWEKGYDRHVNKRQKR